MPKEEKEAIKVCCASVFRPANISVVVVQAREAEQKLKYCFAVVDG